MYGKKGRSENNQMILIHSNLNNRIILIYSNVSKSFKKQHTNMLYCFANRRSLDESSNSIDEKFFLNKIEITRFIRSLFSLTTRERQSKKWVNRNWEYFFKSCKYIFNCLMIRLRIYNSRVAKRSYKAKLGIMMF